MAELRMFIFRQEVLKLYRSFQRMSRLAPPDSQRAQPGSCDWGTPWLLGLHSTATQDLVTGLTATRPRQWTKRRVQILTASLRCHSRRALDLALSVRAGELREQIRQAFEAQSSPRDIEAIKYHLSDGRNQLKQLTDMLNLRA